MESTLSIPEGSAESKTLINEFEAELSAENGSSARPIDQLANAMKDLPPVALPLRHVLTPDLYTRIIFMPAGAVVVGMKHKTNHPYFIMQGRAEVLKARPDGSWEVEGLLTTGYIGITTKGTQRFLRVLEDMVWAAVVANPDNLEDPDEIAATIMIEQDDDYLRNKDDQKLNIWRKENSPSEIINAKFLT